MSGTPPSKPCEQCGTVFLKPPSCGLPAWAKRRFCSRTCKKVAQTGAPSPKLGKSYGPSKMTMLPCRICGGPTRYHGQATSARAALVRCDAEACREASKAQKNAAIAARHLADYKSGKRRRLTENWKGVSRISREEQLLAPALTQRGWIPQYGFTTGQSAFPRYLILDFAKPDRRIYIEIDGSVHRLRRERDARRDAVMQERGWRGLRLPSSLVVADIDKAVHQIDNFFK